MKEYPYRSMRSRLVRAGVGIVGLLALIGALFAAIYLVPGINGSEPENTARYFPEDTPIYAWASISPGIGQGMHMLDLWNRLEEMPEFRDALDDLYGEIEDESGIDFEADVLPWVGPDFSIALLSETDERNPVVALIGVKDRRDASDFLEVFRRYMADDGFELEREDDLHGAEVWADWPGELGFALSGDWLAFANTEDALADVLERVAGEEVTSLADSARFQEARTAMASPRALSWYVDMEALDLSDELPSNVTGLGFQLLSELTGVYLDPVEEAESALDFAAPEWLAGTAGFMERGIAFEVVTPSVSDSLSEFAQGEGIALDDDPAAQFPDDILFMGAVAFEPDMDVWRAELENYTVADIIGYGIEDAFQLEPTENEDAISGDSTLAEALDYVLDLIDEASGLDLETDFFDHLGGQASIAVREFPFDTALDVESQAIDTMATLSHAPGGAEGLMQTLDRVVELLKEVAGEEFPAGLAKDIGADHEAVLFDVDPFVGETAYSPGYVFHDGQLIIGSTERALKSVVDAQSGERASLAEADDYQRARESLPDVLQYLMFLNIGLIIEQLEGDSLGVDQGYGEVLYRALGAVAVGVAVDADYSRASLVLTLFPE